MSKKLLRREVCVGVVGTGEELAISTFPGVIVPVETSISTMLKEGQIGLARTLCELSVAGGLLADPLVLAKGVKAVVLSEREVESELPNGGWIGSEVNMYSFELKFINNPTLAISFFRNLGRTIDDNR